ncbi:hypothetical protein [Streptomyces silvisoli]|uniref:Uncharacterized protein n=1 Tax=Streptomyces silvisoli TaxID=3034235 RepID=A0ABT5ZKS9_9ACTN|nr:hypothetical protein [Streptomyces silvisoli]MDF3290271.1 hypothetical protein [Streptomyces silvisoli]
MGPVQGTQFLGSLQSGHHSAEDGGDTDQFGAHRLQPPSSAHRLLSALVMAGDRRLLDPQMDGYPRRHGPGAHQ